MLRPYPNSLINEDVEIKLNADEIELINTIDNTIQEKADFKWVSFSLTIVSVIAALVISKQLIPYIITIGMIPYLYFRHKEIQLTNALNELIIHFIVEKSLEKEIN